MTFWPAALLSLLLQASPVAPRLGIPTSSPSPTATPTATPEPVQPIPELQDLQFTVGDWVHEKEVSHGGSIGTADESAARSRVMWIHKGHHLFIVYKSRRADGDYEGRGFVGWDGEAKNYRLDWFDSLGHAQRFSGAIDAAGVLVFSADYSAVGAAVTQKISIKKQSAGKLLVLDERKVGSAPMALYFESLANLAAAAPVAPKPTVAPPSPTTKPTTIN